MSSFATGVCFGKNELSERGHAEAMLQVWPMRVTYLFSLEVVERSKNRLSIPSCREVTVKVERSSTGEKNVPDAIQSLQCFAV